MAKTSHEPGRLRGRAALVAIMAGVGAAGCGGDEAAGGSSASAGALAGGAGGSSSEDAGPIRPGASTVGSGGSSVAGGGSSSAAGPSSGGGSGVEPLAPLSSVTVRVVSRHGGPISSAQVSLSGQVDVTNADGIARFVDVAVPYTAMVGAAGDAYVFGALTTERPVLHVGADPDPSRAALSGALQGLASFATTPGARLQQEIVFAADAGRNSTSPSSPDYTIQTRWLESTEGVVRAIQYEYDPAGPLGGYPLNFLVYGAAPAAADDQGVNLSLAPILQRQIDGTVSMPAAAIPERLCVQLLFEDGANLEFERFGAERDEWSYQVPVLEGAEARFGWYVTYPNDAQVHVIEPVSESSEPAVSVPLPLALEAPESGADDVRPGTPLRFEGADDAVHRVQIVSETSYTAPRITLYLEGESTALPDLGEVGILLPEGVEYRWTAWALGGVSSVDELVQAADYAGDIGCGAPRPTRLRSAVSGPWRTFTTACE